MMKIELTEFTRRAPYETKMYFGRIAESIEETLFLSPLIERIQLGETTIYFRRYSTGQRIRPVPRSTKMVAG